MGKIAPILVAALALAVLAGCSGPHKYVQIDMNADLRPSDVARYEQEWKALGSPSGVVKLEHTNLWPLGLIAYQKDSTVYRMSMPEHGTMYHVIDGTGYGPLNLAYAGKIWGTWDGSGKRISTMEMHNYLWMHIGMSHRMDTILPGGHRMKMDSLALFMHMVNIDRMGDETYVSAFTNPNAIGASF